MNTRCFKLVFVCSLIVLSGCHFPAPNESDDTSVHVDLNPVPEPNDRSFEYHGQIGLDGFGTGCISDLKVTLYSANLNRIGSTNVGTLCYGNESTEAKNVTLTASTRPSYIVMESPDFWDNDTGPTPVGYVFDRDSNIYRQYPIVEQGQIKPTGDIADPVPTNTTTTPANRSSILEQGSLTTNQKDGKSIREAQLIPLGGSSQPTLN